ncbi:MAG TPA: glycine--tRNA ligase [Methanomicrobia archaeon]|nr:glycine--tRNA ligase [Methanomicrobia archaeon]
MFSRQGPHVLCCLYVQSRIIRNIYKELSFCSRKVCNMKVDEIMDVALRRGFIFPASEIYGGVSGFWEYGNLGTLMKRKWEDAWRHHFLSLDQNYYEISTSNIMPEAVFKGSGHLEHFNDPLTACTKCNQRFRADDLITDACGKNAEDMTTEEMEVAINEENIQCPRCGGELGPVQLFNMMFCLDIGAAGGTKGYLRPETAQGAFISFKRMFEVLRNRLPIGIGIVGRVYRNEISPRQGFFRLREFNQAELQIFFDPDTFDEHASFDDVAGTPLRVRPLDREEEVEMTAGDFRDRYDIGRFYVYHMVKIQEFYLDALKVPREKFRFRELSERERAFYNKVHWDIEVDMETLGGYKEVAGIHYRTSHDLSGHQEMSKQKMQVNIDGKKFVPHVLELSFGVDRNFWALLDLAFAKEEERTVFRFPPRMAPITVAVFPLLNKQPLIEKATEIYSQLASIMQTDYDRGGSIGRRYRRQDEIGTPFCVTVDFDTLEDGTVTLRDRDTMEQKRVDENSLLGEILSRVAQ